MSSMDTRDFTENDIRLIIGNKYSTSRKLEGESDEEALVRPQKYLFRKYHNREL